MILMETILTIVDNSGGRFAKCINVPTNRSHSAARLGDRISVVISLAKPNKPIKRRQIHKALIIRTIFKNKRKGVGTFKFDLNAIILLGRKNVPVAKRLYGCLMDEFRYSLTYNKILSLTKLII